MSEFVYITFVYINIHPEKRDLCCHDRMVVGFIATYGISVYHH